MKFKDILSLFLIVLIIGIPLGFLNILSIMFIMTLLALIWLSYKEDKVNQVISILKQHKKINNYYPNSLEEINVKNSEYNYFTDSLRNEFTISYIQNGWHVREYSSQEDKWKTRD